jgi:hypothetical protein
MNYLTKPLGHLDGLLNIDVIVYDNPPTSPPTNGAGLMCCPTINLSNCK